MIFTRRQTLIGAAATVAVAALPAAIAKKDIKEGHYRVRDRKTGELFDVEVWQISGPNLWVEGVEWGDEIDAVLESVDFIARRLEIAVSTVKVHRKHIYSKLNINSQAEIFTLLLEVVGATKYEPGRDPLATYQNRQG